MSEPWSTTTPSIPPTTPSYPGAWRPGPPTVGVPEPGWGAAPGPAGPSGPTGGRDPRQRTSLIIAAMAAVVVLLLGALWIVRSSSSGDSASATTPRSSTTTTTEPSTSSTTPASPGPTSPSTTAPTGPVATQAELDAVVAELSTFVESERGLTFKQPVKAVLAADDEFNAALTKDLDESKADFEKEAAVLEPLEMLPPGTDVTAAMTKLLSAGVLGFYDPETKELMVRGQALTPYVKETLVHELVHAIDDQNFDLNRKQYDDAKDEIGFGFSALAEGNARRIEAAWTAKLSPADAAERDAEERAFGQSMDVSGIPIVLLDLLQAPYELGEPFVRRLLADRGQAGLDAAFGTPPDTSEQVIHPDKYESGEKRVEVTPPPADGEVIADGVFGEYLLGLLLIDDATSPEVAAAGWGGDWYVAWKDATKGSCVRMAFQMDSPRDTAELTDALDEWQQTHQQAEIRSTGPNQVELTSCVPDQSGGGSSPL